jgi:hypothetical protein
MCSLGNGQGIRKNFVVNRSEPSSSTTAEYGWIKIDQWETQWGGGDHKRFLFSIFLQESIGDIVRFFPGYGWNNILF